MANPSNVEKELDAEAEKGGGGVKTVEEAEKGGGGVKTVEEAEKGGGGVKT